MRRAPTALLLVLLFATARAGAGGGDEAQPASPPLCSDSWYQFVEREVGTGDGLGHGPDIGTDEWKGTVEFRLGIRGNPEVPARDSEAWCQHIDAIVRERGASPAGQSAPHSAANGDAGAPSFACDRVEAGSIAEAVCSDTELSALDRKLADVYAAASQKAANEHPPSLRAEQRGWIKGRDDCWKSDDRRACVQDAYVLRIAELEARYRLVPSTGPFRFVCDGDPGNEVVATFFRTSPSTLIAERGDSVSFMVAQPSGSGARYQGRNESFWEHHGEATITWGYGAAEMSCQRAD